MTVQDTEASADATERTLAALDAIVRSRTHAPAATWTEAASLVWELDPAPGARPPAEAPELAADTDVLAAGRRALAGLHDLIATSRSAVDAIRYGDASSRLRDALVFDYGSLR